MAREYGTDARALVNDVIAREFQHQLMDLLVWPKMQISSHGKEHYFRDKIGDRIAIKRPFRIKTTRGRQTAASEIRKLVERSVDVEIDTWSKCNLQYNAEDLTLALRDANLAGMATWSEQFLTPGAIEMAQDYDWRGSTEMAGACAFTHGVPGNAVTTQLTQFMYARMIDLSMTMGHTQNLILTPNQCAELSNDIKLINEPDLVGRNIRRSYKGMIANMMTFCSPHIPNLVVPDQTGWNPTVHTGGETGNVLKVKGITAQTNRNFLNKGDLITIVGVHEVKPHYDRRSTGKLQVFVVTADVPSSLSTGVDSEVAVPIMPEINDGTMMINLPDGTTNYVLRDYETVDRLPVTNAAVNVLGRATTAVDVQYEQGFSFDKRALEYFHVQIEHVESMPVSRRRTDERTGLSFSLNKQADINNLSEHTRIDSFFGSKMVYHEVAMRLVGVAIAE